MSDYLIFLINCCKVRFGNGFSDLKLQIFGEDFDQVLIIQWFKLKFCEWNEDHVLCRESHFKHFRAVSFHPVPRAMARVIFLSTKKSTKGFSPMPHLIYSIFHIFRETSKTLILQNFVSFPVHILGPQSHRKIDLPSSIKIITKN